MEKIKVEIDHVDVIKNMNKYSPFAETWIVEKLKKAGIPIIGLFIFGGVEKGTLTRTEDYQSNKIVYTWTNP